MDILPQRPGFESWLAEVGDIANVSKRLFFYLTFLCIRMWLLGSLKGCKIKKLFGVAALLMSPKHFLFDPKLCFCSVECDLTGSLKGFKIIN